MGGEGLFLSQVPELSSPRFCFVFLFWYVLIIPPVEVSSRIIPTSEILRELEREKQILKFEIYQIFNTLSRSEDLNSFSYNHIDPSQELTKK